MKATERFAALLLFCSAAASVLGEERVVQKAPYFTYRSLEGRSASVSQSFTVIGQVQRSGTYDLDPGEQITVSQAILRAGGPTWNPQYCVITRRTVHGKVCYRVSLAAIMKPGKISQDRVIQPGDVISLFTPVFEF